MTSINFDRTGKAFVSSWVGRVYPITATQFHPERPIYEWRSNMGINHAADVVAANRYFGDFFINDARRSTHVFDGSLAAAYSVYSTAHTVISEGNVMDGYQVRAWTETQRSALALAANNITGRFYVCTRKCAFDFFSSRRLTLAPTTVGLHAVILS